MAPGRLRHNGAMPSSLIPRLATANDVSTVCDTLARAFANDPLWGDWTFPGPADRVARLTEFWQPAVLAGIKYGGIWMTPAGEAVAAWVPPGVPEMDAEDEAFSVETTARVCGERAPLVLAAFETFDRVRPTDEHWYLSLLATHPDHRGKGIAMQLVAHRLGHLDATGQAAYLESTNPVNIARYQRAGFDVMDAFDVPGGPRVDQMWRRAHTEPSTDT